MYPSSISRSPSPSSISRSPSPSSHSRTPSPASLIRTPPPYTCCRLSDREVENLNGPQVPENSLPLGWDDAYLRQEACGFDDGLEDATPAAETDKPLLFAPTRVGREVTNLPLSASSLRSGSGVEDVSPTQEAEYCFAPADGDFLPSHQVDSPFAEDVDHSDDDDRDFWDFGEDLEDLVVYYPFRAEDEEDEDEEEVAEVEAEDEGEDEDEDEDEDTVVEDEEIVCRPVSPHTTLDDDAEDEEVAAEDDEDVLPRSVSPCPRTTDPSSSYTPDSMSSTQDPEDDVVDAAPVSRSRRRGQVRRPQSPDTFPEVADITYEQMSSWRKEKRTEFALRRCLVDPDAVIECNVPRCNGRPCGKRFTREDIGTARSHFRAAHFPKEQQKNGTMVVCPWPGCGSTLNYQYTGRHLDKHWGISYQCLFCPEPPIRRTDSLFRHMGGEGCKQVPRICHQTSASRESESIELPEAGPSTQRKRPPRERAQRKKPQARGRAQQKEPEVGPSRGRKRSRRCMEEEEKENVEENEAEVDSDNGDDAEWVPTASARKGKGKQPERKRTKR
ncbi:hypothetical protein LXA43DRAFT_28555 [Ganoderma leucocontextum]|nr:hypothetical protein LXA43DRAFT_28555 [Ganoderma leucocontextum]